MIQAQSFQDLTSPDKTKLDRLYTEQEKKITEGNKKWLEKGRLAWHIPLEEG